MTLLFKMTSAHPDRPHTHNPRVIMRGGVTGVEVHVVRVDDLKDINANGLDPILRSCPADMLHLPVVLLEYANGKDETLAMCGDIYLSNEETGRTVDKILRRDYSPLLNPSPSHSYILPHLSIAGWDDIESVLDLANDIDLRQRGEEAAEGEIARIAVCKAAEIWKDDRPIECIINGEKHVLMARDMRLEHIFNLAGVPLRYDGGSSCIKVKGGGAWWIWDAACDFDRGLTDAGHPFELTVPAPSDAIEDKVIGTPAINYAGSPDYLKAAAAKHQ